MQRVLEWLGVVWLAGALLLPLLLIGSWIADQLDRLSRYCVSRRGNNHGT